MRTPDGSKQSSAHSFWVNDEGLLIKHFRELYILDVQPDGTVYNIVQSSTTTYSGVGEVNTITAPALGE